MHDKGKYLRSLYEASAMQGSGDRRFRQRKRKQHVQRSWGGNT